MKYIQRICLSTIIAVSAVIVAAMPALAASDNETSLFAVEEIVITASRRETSLQDTPQSISALSGEVQQLKGQSGLEDLKMSVPNVNFAATSNTSQLYIRGIGNTFIVAGGDPGVAFYQDGAYVSDTTSTNTNFFDVERIEILRGPQGALYGRNSTGGAINVISAKPTSELEGRVSVATGNYGMVNAGGYVSGPLDFANTDARVSFQTEHHNGYVDNTYEDAFVEPNAPTDLDDLDSESVRVQTLTHLPGDGSLGLVVSSYDRKDNGPALAVTETPSVQYPAELLFGVRPGSDARNVSVNAGSYESSVTTFNANYKQPIRSGDLTVVLNYRKSSQDFLNDCDGTRIANCKYIRETDSKDYYSEAYYASDADSRVRWLVGASYSKFDQFQRNVVTWQMPLSYVVPGADSSIPFELNVDTGGDLDVESYALYGDVRFAINDDWAFSGQVRYSKTKKDGVEHFSFDSFGIDVADLPIAREDSSVPFKFILEGRLTNDVLVYTSYSTAFKDGAINIGAGQVSPVSEEEVESIETGFKGSFFERRLQVNGAVFHSEYTGLQISQLVGTIVALTNVPKAEINGAELEIVATPIEGLKLNASVGYLDPTIKEFSNTRTTPPGFVHPTDPTYTDLLDLAGNQLPYVAKWSVNLGASYTFEVIEDYNFSLGGDFSFQGRTYFNEFNDDSVSQASVGVFNGTASFGPVDESWLMYFYAKNIADKTIATGTTIYAGLLGAERAVSYAPPRTVGVGFSYLF